MPSALVNPIKETQFHKVYLMDFMGEIGENQIEQSQTKSIACKSDDQSNNLVVLKLFLQNK